MTETLHPAAPKSLPETSDQASNDVSDHPPQGPKFLHLGGQIRALIKEYFAENELFRLPPEHTAIIFTEGQISNVLRVVADETVRASYDKLQNIVYRASRLSLTSEPVGSGTNKKGSPRRGSYVVTRGGRYSILPQGVAVTPAVKFGVMMTLVA